MKLTHRKTECWATNPEQCNTPSLRAKVIARYNEWLSKRNQSHVVNPEATSEWAAMVNWTAETNSDETQSVPGAPLLGYISNSEMHRYSSVDSPPPSPPYTPQENTTAAPLWTEGILEKLQVDLTDIKASMADYFQLAVACANGGGRSSCLTYGGASSEVI